MELTEQEEEAIARLVKSPSLVEALLKIFEQVIGDVRINFEVNNEEIGARLRARYQAEQMIKQGFKKLESYRAVEELTEKDNPAR